MMERELKKNPKAVASRCIMDSPSICKSYYVPVDSLEGIRGKKAKSLSVLSSQTY